MGAWIETPGNDDARWVRTSRPVWARGLKQAAHLMPLEAIRRAPYGRVD